MVNKLLVLLIIGVVITAGVLVYLIVTEPLPEPGPGGDTEPATIEMNHPSGMTAGSVYDDLRRTIVMPSSGGHFQFDSAIRNYGNGDADNISLRISGNVGSFLTGSFVEVKLEKRYAGFVTGPMNDFFSLPPAYTVEFRVSVEIPSCAFGSFDVYVHNNLSNDPVELVDGAGLHVRVAPPESQPGCST